MKTNQEIIDSGKVCNFSQMEVNGISIMCGEIYEVIIAASAGSGRSILRPHTTVRTAALR